MKSGVYDYIAQDRVIFGVPAAQAVAEQAAALKKSRLLVVASKTLHRGTPAIREIVDALGDRCIGVYDECVEHVPRGAVLSLAKRIRDEQPDLIVTVGGGTPMDTVKVALVALAENCHAEQDFDRVRIQVDAAGKRIVPSVAPPPVRQIIVPTTLSGGEFSMLAGATDPTRQVKDLYTGRYIGGQIVILDPSLTVHTPDRLWLSTGVRAIDHAVETICSRTAQPLTDATSIHALRMLSQSLRTNRQVPTDLDARLASQQGVWLATMGIGRVEWGASHGIGHQLGAVANVPHGHCSCVLLPSVLRWNAETNADRQHLIAEALGSSDDAPDAVATLIADLGQPTCLQDVGVRRDQFEAIARGAMQNMMVRSNPREIASVDDILAILEMAW
ncbi:iron-containing alcohol dehydrogenase [Cupriavidus nantongensis]|uniref:Alcohol dehydrogenase n=1 Tax=Cupriavidus nantongensis TaxID=1796606 RepID=A0A142JMC3_9BURK|nr:iron-containing alcohol dehydrogenase [Cupriavidus nantongensis]AMR79235.1 alcohol dehydrogenase [Cupriavidus nantongensis]